MTNKNKQTWPFNQPYTPTVKSSAIFQRFNTFKDRKQTKLNEHNYNKTHQYFNRHSSQNKFKHQLNPQKPSKLGTSFNSKINHHINFKLKKAMTLTQDRFSTIGDKQQQKVKLDIPSFVKRKSYGKKYQEIQIKQRFKEIKKLGQGKFGQVYLVVQKITNMIFAMKIVKKKTIVERGLIQQFIRELKLQSYLHHPNIIQLYGFLHDSTQFYLLFQCGCNGQLYQIIEKCQFSQSSTSAIIRSILSAISYMHSNNVIHRDIKPQNIVIVHGVVKLCDLGWAVNTEKQQLRTTFCGTPLYLSPQLLTGSKYDKKVDLWAIGVLCFQLLYKVSPFDIKNHHHLLRIVTNQITYPSPPSSTLKTFIEAILQKNPRQRLSAQELLKFNFICKYVEMESEQLI